jgi:hypothetical protein
MQYTIRRIPIAVDQALRERANRQRRSINEVAIQAMTEGLGLKHEKQKRRDLGDLAGRWVKDPAVDKALEDQRAIDDELWG